MIAPPYLKIGDKVAITCPAKKLPHEITDAINLLQSWGLEVILGDTVFASYNQFAGNDDFRAWDLQRFIDDDSIKAIFAARGGYGSIRIIDAVNFTKLKTNPKWIIGFSDITVLHSHIQANYQVQTIHGQMPLTIPDGTKPSIESLRIALFGSKLQYQIPVCKLNRLGNTGGILIGGNLTLMVMMAGSDSEIDYTNKILFLEDVGEYLYSIDRMLWCLKRSGKFSKLKGLIVGGFTDLKDNDIPFGQSVEEIILNHVSAYDYPVCFNFPAGHLSDNHALILGKCVNLIADENEVSLSFVD